MIRELTISGAIFFPPEFFFCNKTGHFKICMSMRIVSFQGANTGQRLVAYMVNPCPRGQRLQVSLHLWTIWLVFAQYKNWSFALVSKGFVPSKMYVCARNLPYRNSCLKKIITSLRRNENTCHIRVYIYISSSHTAANRKMCEFSL